MDGDIIEPSGMMSGGGRPLSGLIDILNPGKSSKNQRS